MENIKKIIGNNISTNLGFYIADIIEINVRHKLYRNLGRTIDEKIRFIIDNNMDMLIRDILKNNQLKH